MVPVGLAVRGKESILEGNSITKMRAEVKSWEPSRACGEIRLENGEDYEFRVHQCNTSEFQIGDFCLAEFATRPLTLSKLRFTWDWTKNYFLLNDGIREFRALGILCDWTDAEFAEQLRLCEREFLSKPLDARNPESKRTFELDRAEQSIVFNIPESNLVPLQAWKELPFRYYDGSNPERGRNERALVLIDTNQSEKGDSSVEFWNAAFAECNHYTNIAGPVIATRKGKSVTVKCANPPVEVKISLGWGVVFACDCASTYNEILKQVNHPGRVFISVRRPDQMLLIFREHGAISTFMQNVFKAARA